MLPMGEMASAGAVGAAPINSALETKAKRETKCILTERGEIGKSGMWCARKVVLVMSWTGYVEEAAVSVYIHIYTLTDDNQPLSMEESTPNSGLPLLRIIVMHIVLGKNILARHLDKYGYA